MLPYRFLTATPAPVSTPQEITESAIQSNTFALSPVFGTFLLFFAATFFTTGLTLFVLLLTFLSVTFLSPFGFEGFVGAVDAELFLLIVNTAFPVDLS